MIDIGECDLPVPVDGRAADGEKETDVRDIEGKVYAPVAGDCRVDGVVGLVAGRTTDEHSKLARRS